MKNLIFAIPIITLLINCHTSTQNNLPAAAVNEDSLSRAAYREKQRDSLIKAEEGKAIANIMFGISKSQFEKEEKIFIDKSKVVKWKSDDGHTFYQNKIGDYKFSSISPGFYEEKLYSVYIQGEYIHYDDYNSEMRAQKEAIEKILSEKFGEPEFSFPVKEWHTMERNTQYSAARWRVGEKLINTNYANRGTYFTYDISIFLPEINGKILEEERIRAEEVSKKGLESL